MNRIHRTVFNARLGTVVAVAETARSRGKAGASTATVQRSASRGPRSTWPVAETLLPPASRRASSCQGAAPGRARPIC